MPETILEPESEPEKNQITGTGAILSSLGEGISVQDRNFRIIYQNPAHIKSHGRHVGEYCFNAYLNAEKACENCPVIMTFGDGKPHIVEKIKTTQAGLQYIEISASPLTDSAGNVIAGIEIVRDITERKKNEDELNSYRERLEELVEEKTVKLENKISELQEVQSRLRNSERVFAGAQKVAGIGSWEWDIIKGKLNWSDELYSIYGYSPHEITPDYDLVVETLHPNSKEVFLGGIDAALRGGRSFDLDYAFFRKDGSAAVLHTAGEVIYDRNGNPERMIGIVQDITLRKKNEIELIERARHASLCADIGVSTTKETALTEMLQECAEAMVVHLDAAFARIWKFNDDEQMLELQASAGIYTHLDGRHSRIPLGSFKIGLIALEQKPHISNEVVGDLLIHDQEWALREGIVSFAGYPLIIGNRLVGVMALFSRNILSDAALNVLASTADVISLGIKRKKTEEDLKLFSLAVEEAGDGIHLLDLNGRILYANQAHEWMYGYSPADLIGENVSMLTADSEHDQSAVLAAIRETGRWDGEIKALHKNGRILPIWLTATLVKNDAGIPIAVLGIFRDITDRKQAEEALRAAFLRAEEERAKTEAIIAAIGDAVSIQDIDYKILYQNQVSKDLYGDHIGEYCYRAYQDKDHICKKCHLTKAFRDSMVQNMEQSRTTDKGTVYYDITASPLKDSAGKIIAGIEVVRDITERKRYEQKLEELNARLQTLIEAIPDIVVFKDTMGRHLIVNKAMEKLTGLSRDKIIGKTEFDLLPPEFAEACRRSDEEVLQSLVPMRFEEISPKEDGQKIYYETIKAPIFNHRKKVAGLVSVSRDATDRRLAEEKVKKVNRDLKAQIVNLETAYKDMESFSYTASHDLRQPLMIISWFARNLNKVYADKLDERGREDLGIISQNVTIMERLINDLLAFSKVSTKKIKVSEINMRALVERVYDELRKPLGDREIRLELKTLPDIYGDVSMIQLLFTNLISNAIKYSSAGKTSELEIGSILKKNENIYYVRDNGVGFDMAHADMLFGLFQRLHSSSEFEGTGVGLSTAKRIVEKHKGRIWAEGKLNEGATFFFSLPKRKRKITAF